MKPAYPTFDISPLETRLKLLLIATLAFAFLLLLLQVPLEPLRLYLLRSWCHRTGRRCRVARVPLYRLRSALSTHSAPPPQLDFARFAGG